MKVRSSTRATSVGSEAAWNELGLMSLFRRVKVPEATSWSVSVFHSWSEPVTQEMRSGVVSAATSFTQAASRVWLVEPSLWICRVVLVIVIGSAIPFCVTPSGDLQGPMMCVQYATLVQFDLGATVVWYLCTQY